MPFVAGAIEPMQRKMSVMGLGAVQGPAVSIHVGAGRGDQRGL